MSGRKRVLDDDDEAENAVVVVDDEEEEDNNDNNNARSSVKKAKAKGSEIKRRLMTLDEVKFAMSSAKLRRALKNRELVDENPHKNIKFSVEALKGVTELMDVFVKEATRRAVDDAEDQDDCNDKTIKPEHLVRILPRLLLDM